MRYKYLLLITFLFITSCTFVAKHELDSKYGEQKVKSRIVSHPTGPDFLTQVKPILDRRCVVCHSCYDAPCQLKLSSIEGIDRGSTKRQVYLAERLFSADPTRLFIDAKNTEAWRDKDFSPVLNERKPSANLEGSTFYQMLELKRKYDDHHSKILSKAYDFSLDRGQICPKIEEFKSYAKNFPLWGMPYGFPKLSDKEHEIIRDWLNNGAQSKPTKKHYNNPLVKKWENFFNRKGNKSKLVSRYIYEHLFLANIYFENNKSLGYFRLVRSKTPSGEPIEIIPTRKPYEYPGKEFYYRLWSEHSTISEKVYMPYRLDDSRLKRWNELFVNKEFKVKKLPPYDKDHNTNPFKTFADIPVNSRYKFMLDEAEFTVMGFIKGPVCRGNKALNVIEDRFWVMFTNPDLPMLKHEDDFIKEQVDNLRLPSDENSNAFIISTWLKYSKQQQKFLKAKEQRLKDKFPNPNNASLEIIWDGDGKNKNAALTIFRHNDSASITKGFIGETPKTAWIVGYSLLERIHYLLVAGFDIYGNVIHQFNSRLYMDFLRMEGEYNFLSLLPHTNRISIRNYWYRDADKTILNFLKWGDVNILPGVKFKYKTNNHKEELLTEIKRHLIKVANSDLNINNQKNKTSNKLITLTKNNAHWITIMPNVALLRVKSKNGYSVYSIIKDVGFSNVSTPFNENDRRLPKEDMITITKGVISAYPNAFYEVKEEQLEQFIQTLKAIKSEHDYSKMLDSFGIRRNSVNFWEYSDWINDYFAKTQNGKLLDYNRFENR